VSIIHIFVCHWVCAENKQAVTVKPGFHGPSTRPELTGVQFPLPVNTGRVDGPCSRVMETAHPSTRAVYSGRVEKALSCNAFLLYGPSTRLVETERPCTRPVQVDIDQSQFFVDSLLHCYVYYLHTRHSLFIYVRKFVKDTNYYYIAWYSATSSSSSSRTRVLLRLRSLRVTQLRTQQECILLRLERRSKQRAVTANASLRLFFFLMFTV